MVCQNVRMSQARPVAAFNKKTRTANRHIRRIQNAKRLVCGEINAGPLAGLQKELEKVLELFDPALKLLVSGHLDTLTAENLRSTLAMLQKADIEITRILSGGLSIGLEGRAPFPMILSKLREKQLQLQSQIEGVLLSLDDPFQELVKKSATAIDISA